MDGDAVTRYDRRRRCGLARGDPPGSATWRAPLELAGGDQVAWQFRAVCPVCLVSVRSELEYYFCIASNYPVTL